jgi:hypothetical protein
MTDPRMNGETYPPAGAVPAAGRREQPGRELGYRQILWAIAVSSAAWAPVMSAAVAIFFQPTPNRLLKKSLAGSLLG